MKENKHFSRRYRSINESVEENNSGNLITDIIDMLVMHDGKL